MRWMAPLQSRIGKGEGIEAETIQIEFASPHKTKSRTLLSKKEERKLSEKKEEKKKKEHGLEAFGVEKERQSSLRRFFENPIRFLLGNPQLTFDDIGTPEPAKPEVKPAKDNLKPRDKLAAELRKQADELEKEILQEIQNFKPKGKMSEFAEVMMGAGMTSPYKNDEIVSTPFGTIVFVKARSPDKRTVATWEEKHKKSDELRSKALQYSFSLVPKPHITTGNFRVVEQGKRLHEQGLLTPEEIRELEKLEKFWQDHPELDRQKDVGMWNEKLELVPWKSGIGKPETKPADVVHKHQEEKGIKPEPEKTAEKSWEFKPNAGLINKQLAERSHMGTSWDPEKRAEQEISGFVQDVQAVFDRLKPYAKTEAQKALLIEEMQRFQIGYAEKYNDKLAAHGRTISSFITGASKFPTRRAEKASASYEKKWQDMLEWKDRAEKAIIRKLKGEAIEEAGGEIPLLQKKIEQAEKLQEMMVEANKIIRKKPEPGVGGVSKLQQLVNIGFTEKQAAELLKPDFAGRLGFSFQLTNNSAEIRRLKERIVHLQGKEAKETSEAAFTGGRIVDNREADRVQIFFDQKPSQDVISKLKGEGWHWSPSIGAWQRKRTEYALMSANRITGAQAETQFAQPEQVEKGEGKPEPEGAERDSTIVKRQVEALGVRVLRAKIDPYSSNLIRLTVPTGTQNLPDEVKRETARGFNGLPISTKTWVWLPRPEQNPKDVIGYPPNPIMRMQLLRLWKEVLGAEDIGDFETFMKEAADLTYDEAKEKLLLTYGQPKQMTAGKEARYFGTKASEAEERIHAGMCDHASEECRKDELWGDEEACRVACECNPNDSDACFKALKPLLKKFSSTSGKYADLSQEEERKVDEWVNFEFDRFRASFPEKKGDFGAWIWYKDRVFSPDTFKTFLRESLLNGWNIHDSAAQAVEDTQAAMKELGKAKAVPEPSSGGRKFPDRKSETKAVKDALHKAGIEAEVSHGTGTSWGWLEINIGDPRLRGGLKPAPFEHQYTDEELALQNKVLKIAQEVTGRRGEYDGKISVLAQEWRRKPSKEKEERWKRDYEQIRAFLQHSEIKSVQGARAFKEGIEKLYPLLIKLPEKEANDLRKQILDMDKLAFDTLSAKEEGRLRMTEGPLKGKTAFRCPECMRGLVNFVCGEHGRIAPEEAVDLRKIKNDPKTSKRARELYEYTLDEAGDAGFSTIRAYYDSLKDDGFKQFLKLAVGLEAIFGKAKKAVRPGKVIPEITKAVPEVKPVEAKPEEKAKKQKRKARKPEIVFTEYGRTVVKKARSGVIRLTDADMEADAVVISY